MEKNQRGVVPQIDRKIPQMHDRNSGILPFVIEDAGEPEYIEFEEVAAFKDAPAGISINDRWVRVGVAAVVVLVLAVLLAYLLSLIIDLLFKTAMIAVAAYVVLCLVYVLSQVRRRAEAQTDAPRDVYIENNVSRETTGRITIINKIY